MIKVNDKWLRIGLILVPCSLFLYNFLPAPGARALYIPVFVAITILICEGSRFWIKNSRSWFGEPSKKNKRLAALIPVGIGWVCLCFMAGKLLRNLIEGRAPGFYEAPGGFTLQMNEKQVELGLVGSSIFYGILVFLLLLCIHELAWHFARLRHTERERDRLEKEKLLAELQQLRGMMNPHFLFNNLNSLSSLITENPANAEEFLDQLTKVFRYLLRNNETELIQLSEELKFIRSYYHLLQTRYGDAIEMEMNVDPKTESNLLPPLTLQQLVENAVKHNRFHKDYPLHIHLFTDHDGRLVVRNNVARREQPVESTGIGLRSINTRYELMNQMPLVIRRDPKAFWVIIQLIVPGAPPNFRMRKPPGTRTTKPSNI